MRQILTGDAPIFYYYTRDALTFWRFILWQADSGQPPQAARQNFLEIPNPRPATTSGRIEVTDVRPETVTGKLLDESDNPVLEGGRPVYVCVRKADLVDPRESAKMMIWWELGEQVLTAYATLRKYSLESLINRLDGLNSDEMYALRTFVCLESDPFKAYSGTANSNLSHLQVWFPTVRALDRAELSPVSLCPVYLHCSRPTQQSALTALSGRSQGRSIPELTISL